MLFYLFLYLLAAVLVFQGVQLLGELHAPMGVVPVEVQPDPLKAARVGGFLTAMGGVLGLVGLLSHSCPWFVGAVGPLRILGFLTLAGYGLWLVFGRTVAYTPVRSQDPAPPSH